MLPHSISQSIRESFDEFILFDNLTALIGNLLLGLVELCSIGVLLEGDLEG